MVGPQPSYSGPPSLQNHLDKATTASNVLCTHIACLNKVAFEVCTCILCSLSRSLKRHGPEQQPSAIQQQSSYRDNHGGGTMCLRMQ